jgi:hypothetical protein
MRGDAYFNIVFNLKDTAFEREDIPDENPLLVNASQLWSNFLV